MHAPVAITLLSLLLLAPASTAAQTKNFEHTAALDAGGRLSVTADISDLRLTSWDRNQVEVIARIRARDDMSADYARRAVEATQIVVTGDARSLTIRADYSRVPTTGVLNGNSRILPHIDYEIRAPRRLDLTVKVDRSTAEIDGFEGTLVLESDRTRLHAADLSGDVRLNIDRGMDVRLENVRGRVQFDADRTDVTVRQLALTGDSQFDVGRGRLDLFMASGAGLTLSVDRERRSRFDTDFPLTTSTVRSGRIEGTINGGGPRLSIGTDRAQVHLRN